MWEILPPYMHVMEHRRVVIVLLSPVGCENLYMRAWRMIRGVFWHPTCILLLVPLCTAWWWLSLSSVGCENMNMKSCYTIRSKFWHPYILLLVPRCNAWWWLSFFSGCDDINMAYDTWWILTPYIHIATSATVQRMVATALMTLVGCENANMRSCHMIRNSDSMIRSEFSHPTYILRPVPQGTAWLWMSMASVGWDNTNMRSWRIISVNFWHPTHYISRVMRRLL